MFYSSKVSLSLNHLSSIKGVRHTVTEVTECLIPSFAIIFFFFKQPSQFFTVTCTWYLVPVPVMSYGTLAPVAAPWEIWKVALKEWWSWSRSSLGLGTLGFRFKTNILHLYLSSQLIFPTHRETSCGIHKANGAEGGLGNGTGAFIFQKRHRKPLKKDKRLQHRKYKGR